MRVVLAILFCVGLALAKALPRSAGSPPSKPEWPWEFDAPFGFNDVHRGFVNETSHFYYSWPLRSTKITYPAKCPGFVPYVINGTQPCNFIFNLVGTFLIAPQAGITCCLYLPNIGPVPPAFLKPFNFSAVDWALDYYGNNHTTDYWKAYSSAGEFAYWTGATSGNDIQFQDGTPTTMWNWGPLNTRHQNWQLFELPGPCAPRCPNLPGMEKAVPNFMKEFGRNDLK